MLAHRIISFAALGTLLASHSGIYLDAFKAIEGVAIPACVVDMISLASLLTFFFFFFFFFTARIVQHI